MILLLIILTIKRSPRTILMITMLNDYHVARTIFTVKCIATLVVHTPPPPPHTHTPTHTPMLRYGKPLGS